MIEQDLLIRSITEATRDVFSTMLDMQIEYVATATEAPSSASTLISLVGITGEWAGSGVMCCSPALAAKICAQMLGTEAQGPAGAQAITEEVMDVVAEVSNMVVGNIKNGLETVTGPLAISVPTVIHGRNFQFRNSPGLRGAALTFAVGAGGSDEQFEVRISLAPSPERGTPRSRLPVFGLANV